MAEKWKEERLKIDRADCDPEKEDKLTEEILVTRIKLGKSRRSVETLTKKR